MRWQQTYPSRKSASTPSVRAATPWAALAGGEVSKAAGVMGAEQLPITDSASAHRRIGAAQQRAVTLRDSPASHSHL